MRTDAAILREAVGRVKHRAKSNSPITVLQCILLTPDRDGRSSLTACDGTGFARAFFEGDGEDGPALLNAARLSDAANALRGDVAARFTERSVVFEDGRTKVTIPFLDADDFPCLPPLEGEPVTCGEVGPDAEWLQLAASNDAHRAVLMNMHRSAAGWACTDTHRLHFREGAFDPSPAIFPVGLDMTGHVVRAGNNYVVTHAWGWEAVQVPGGTFPNWPRVVPNEPALWFVCEPKDMAAAIKAAMPFAQVFKDVGRKVRIAPKGEDMLELTCRDEGGEEVVVETAAIVDKECPTFAVNGQYLLDALKVDDEAVRVEGTSSSRMFVVRPQDATNPRRAVIAPMGL